MTPPVQTHPRCLSQPPTPWLITSTTFPEPLPTHLYGFDGCIWWVLSHLDPHGLAEEAEGHWRVVSHTFLQTTEVNRILGKSGRCPSLQPAHSKPQFLQRVSQPDGWLVPQPPRRVRLQPNVDHAPQKRAGGEDNAPSMYCAPIPWNSKCSEIYTFLCQQSPWTLVLLSKTNSVHWGFIWLLL